MATTEKAEKTVAEIARSYFEAVGNRDVEGMLAHWHPDNEGGYIHGMVDVRVPDTYRGWFTDLFTAFPDWRFEILDIVADDERAAVRWRASGTFTGPPRFEGMEPNGAAVESEGCDVLTIRDGKIVSNYAYTNGAEMARQLGALPPQGSAAEKAMLGALNLKTRLTQRLRRR
jgi:predicted ester cyclase